MKQTLITIAIIFAVLFVGGLTIAAVTEAYPEIKSTELYKQTMLEFSATENRLA